MADVLWMSEPGVLIQPALQRTSWVSLCQGLPLVALTPLVLPATSYEGRAAGSRCNYDAFTCDRT